ncbi:GNAT family N-acetyltransferase [Aquibacillus salsiterrae]|uniref:GNAT family N-acetyltransferase n=1 Tax=Aquibacillus salsiterrae TaxID=2950439 RepID=A0A9X3WHB7_9BACI|nr:GNAT family N-acetyltransferase [Aquibacillus salsiterrae]MDC3418431.1 GNAT family N-acetyltransferase [Aquibacillus salsiterrae]
MLIRKATETELHIIKQHRPIVQKEATVGYLDTNVDIPPDLYVNNSSYYVIVDNQTLVGWVQIGDTIDNYDFEKVGIITELYILPHFRKQGYGKKLIQAALTIFKRRGLKRAQLNVFAGNKAKTLYESLGFKDISTVMEKYLDRD